MSFINYLGLLLISICWIWKLYLYRPPSGVWIVLLLLGIVLVSFRAKSRGLFGGSSASRDSGSNIGEGGWKDEEESYSGKLPGVSAILLVPLALLFFQFPHQIIIGPVILFIAITVGVLMGERGRVFRPVEGVLLAGMVLTLQAFLFPLMAVFSAHFHDIPLLGYLIYPFVNLFDPSAAVSGGKIFVSSVEEIFGFSVSLEKLAFFPMAMFFISVLIFRFFKGDAVGLLLKIVVVFVIYSAVRFIVMFFAAVLSNSAKLFWEPWVFLVSLIPLALLLAWIVPFNTEKGVRDSQDRVQIPGTPGKTTPSKCNGKCFVTSAIFTLSFFFVVGSVMFHDPGVLKEGRVLFDEYYSDWEWSTRKYDRSWYGTKSGYNYYCLAEYIDHFYHLERGTEPYTPEYLSRYDVVVLKTPTRYFEPEVIEILVDYVEEGGGLFLIGDHTNVFGTSTNLNPLAAEFGMRFDYNSTYQLDSGALSYHVNTPIGVHPSLLHVEDFLFATSCTIQSPILGENVMISNAVKAVHLDYSRKSYFPAKDEKEYDFGFLNLMSGVKFGKGRVLGFTDSTVFSNFFMFIPGKPELFIGSLDWLNRTNRWSILNPVFFFLGVGGIIWGGMRFKNWQRFAASGVVMFGLLLGSVISIYLFESLKKDAYTYPEAMKKIKSITFDRDPSTFELPTRHLVRNKKSSLHTFYVWTQRVGFVPSLYNSLEESLASSRIAVIANPRRKLTVDEMSAVINFCRSGGNILLLVNPGNRRGGTDDLLGIFRMSRSRLEPDTTEIWNLKGETICPAYEPGLINGGIPMLTLPGGRVVMAYEELGKGRFFAFNDFLLFSQASMGPTSTIPSPDTRRIYELEFQILEILSGDRDPRDIKPFSPES